MTDIVDILINDGRFTTLVEAINRASLLQGLMEPAAITLRLITDIYIINTVLVPQSVGELLVAS